MQPAATVVPKITGAITCTTLPKGLFQTWKHLWAKHPLVDTYPGTEPSTNIDLLIGNDYLDLTLPTRIELKPGLYLLASRLGWIFSGRTSIFETAPERTESMLVMSTSTPSYLPNVASPSVSDNICLLAKPDLEALRNVESIGITDSPILSDDDCAQAQFNASVQQHDGRYCVSWPWKEGYELPGNYFLAKGRLTSLLRHFEKHPEMLQNTTMLLSSRSSLALWRRLMKTTQLCQMERFTICCTIQLLPLRTTPPRYVLFMMALQRAQLQTTA